MHEITSEEYIDIIVENTNLPLYPNSHSTSIDNLNSLLHIPASEIDKCSLGKYPFYVFPTLYTLESTISLEKSGIQQIQLNPNFNLYGQGVLVGIVDTGIEYQHEAFLNREGTSKIAFLWDQTIQDGDPPEGFTFGTEYSKAQINTALISLDPLSIVPSQDEIGHGTALAGIIAGNEKISANFRGIVPDSELVIVKLKPAKKINKEIFNVPPDLLCFQESDIILGLTYLLSISKKLNRPLAICLALGSNSDGHDGYGMLSLYISTYINRLTSIAIATSAGNEGNAKRHYLGNTQVGQSTTEFELKIGKNENSFSMELWQQTPYRLSIDINSPTGEYIAPVYPGINECFQINFIFEATTIWINNTTFENESGDQLILLRFANPHEGIWKFGVSNLDNTASSFNVWLPSGDLITNETYFLEPNPDITITSPGNAIDSATITAYDPATGGIAIFSSRGYTRIGGIKPDLAAPGVNLTCPTLKNNYGTISGTGAATAHSIGIMAMVLEWAVVSENYPAINGFAIKELLIRGAKREPILTYPNNIWGYGKIDIYGLFKMLIV